MRVAVGIALFCFVSFFGVLLFDYIEESQVAVMYSKIEAYNKIKVMSASIEEILIEKYKLARSLIDHVEAFKQGSDPTAEFGEVVALVAGYLERDEDKETAGYWVNFEFGSLTQHQVAELVRKGKKKNKQATTYTFRQGDRIETDFDFKDNSRNIFYEAPFRTGETYFTDPYIFEDVLMITISIPIYHDEKVIGVGGVDLDISGLTETIRLINTEGVGHNRLISDNLVVIADGRDIQNSGKNLNAIDDMAKIYAQVATGQTVMKWSENSSTKDVEYLLYTPVKINDSGVVWMLEFSLPKRNLE